jgi:hypothetical protein
MTTTNGIGKGVAKETQKAKMMVIGIGKGVAKEAQGTEMTREERSFRLMKGNKSHATKRAKL